MPRDPQRNDLFAELGPGQNIIESGGCDPPRPSCRTHPTTCRFRDGREPSLCADESQADHPRTHRRIRGATQGASWIYLPVHIKGEKNNVPTLSDSIDPANMPSAQNTLRYRIRIRH